MIMKSLLLTIIVPICNSVLFLRKCLDRILAQRLKDCELICVNNDSTDGSSEILGEYGVKDSRQYRMLGRRLYKNSCVGYILYFRR